MTTELDHPPDLWAQLASTGALRTTGLYLAKPDLEFDQLFALGVMLGRGYQSFRFAIGDYLLLCENQFPEKFSQAIEALGISEGGAMEFLRVSEKVPKSVRRESLSWSHHRAVASMSTEDGQPDVKQQKAALERAEKQRLSHHAFRDELRNGHEPRAATVCRCCGRSLDAG